MSKKKETEKQQKKKELSPGIFQILLDQ